MSQLLFERRCCSGLQVFVDAVVCFMPRAFRDLLSGIVGAFLLSCQAPFLADCFRGLLNYGERYGLGVAGSVVVVQQAAQLSCLYF